MGHIKGERRCTHAVFASWADTVCPATSCSCCWTSLPWQIVSPGTVTHNKAFHPWLRWFCQVFCYSNKTSSWSPWGGTRRRWYRMLRWRPWPLASLSLVVDLDKWFMDKDPSRKRSLFHLMSQRPQGQKRASRVLCGKPLFPVCANFGS